jgi:hypothetical protein
MDEARADLFHYSEKAKGGFCVKSILLALVFSMFASIAYAQFYGAGGFAPHSFNSAAAAAGNSGANSWSSNGNAAQCRTEHHGRSGPVIECGSQRLATPNK